MWIESNGTGTICNPEFRPIFTAPVGRNMARPAVSISNTKSNNGYTSVRTTNRPEITYPDGRVTGVPLSAYRCTVSTVFAMNAGGSPSGLPQDARMAQTNMSRKK